MAMHGDEGFHAGSDAPAGAEEGGAYLVGCVRPGELQGDVEAHVEELSALSETVGYAETGRAILPLRRINAATFIGAGQAEEVGVMARGLGASIIAVDEELSPAQARNLEKATELPVVDRAGLIIEIFAQHARSREARTQVEIARMEYLLPRLAGRWTHLSRQAGGGPGGTKGEGEKQIELDRRMIRRRIASLRRELGRLDRARGVRRRSRETLSQVALVGYTNVGKSSIFNAMVDAGVLVQDQLFATLDATVRRVELGARGSILVKDTVGFIRKLPHHLVESFKTTFEEAGEADLLLVVLDLSHPAMEDQLATVETVLDQMGLGERDRLIVFNKIDAAPEGLVEHLRGTRPGALLISAKTGEGVPELVDALGDRLLGREVRSTVSIPEHRGDLLAFLSKRGRVESAEANGSQSIDVTLTARAEVFAELEKRLGESA